MNVQWNDNVNIDYGGMRIASQKKVVNGRYQYLSSNTLRFVVVEDVVVSALSKERAEDPRGGEVVSSGS